MDSRVNEIIYDVTLQPGEPLSLPKEAASILGPGQWLISIRPADAGAAGPIRDHSAFLSSYAPEDDGLYDDVTSG
jgi:hypothetical protein